MSQIRNYRDVIKLTRAMISEPHRARGVYRNFMDAKSEEKGIRKKLIIDQLSRTKVEISDWRDALDNWEMISNPDRYKMMELYQEIELDDQVTAKIETVKLKINATEYNIYNTKTKKENLPIKEKVFDRMWFMVVLNHMIDHFFQGHSLIQFGDWDVKTGYKWRDIEIVPRYLVSPEMGIVRKRQGDTEGIRFRDNAFFARHLIEIGGKRDKGLFASLATLYIFKKNALSFWSDFQQRYGEPILAFNTDLNNSKNVDKLYDFILNRGNAGGVVLDINDVATILEAEKTDAFRVFHEMILLNNGGISKVLEGETMTTDSDSGKFKGDIHADTALIFHLGRLKILRFYINDELLPKMRRDGFAIDEDEIFRWKEFKNIDEIINRLVKLAAYYHIKPSEVYDMTGIRIEKERDIVSGKLRNEKKVPDKDDKGKTKK